MLGSLTRGLVALGVAAPLAALYFRGAPRSGPALPAPEADVSAVTAGALETAVFAGGCFWGIEAVFEHVRGVSDAVSGYAGGSAKNADYELVGTGTTGHAEAVKVTYDPSQVTYGDLLRVFFSVAHDPTQLNRQGPDMGPQYRSALFYATPEQKRVAEAYVGQLTQAKAFKAPIVTQIVPLEGFYLAEAYHQNYMVQHPNQPYIVIHDKPKVEALRKQLPDLYRDSKTASR